MMKKLMDRKGEGMPRIRELMERLTKARSGGPAARPAQGKAEGAKRLMERMKQRRMMQSRGHQGRGKGPGGCEKCGKKRPKAPESKF
ncbi:MAG: hypothetical protein ACYTFG_09225 [Planctomycetota bacterium]|jgi:hypothetical protein